MEDVLSNDDRIAIAEVDYIIHHMNERYLNKIPKKVLDYITILKKRNLEIYVDPRVPLENQGLKEFTLYFLMVLNLKYWCNDERRKEILAIMENNQKKFDERVNNIFDKAETMQSSEEVSLESENLNRPKQVLIANQQQVTSKEINEEMNSSIEQTEFDNTRCEDNAANMLNDLKEENAMVSTDTIGNFFKKFVSKIKAILTRSKQ